VRLDKFTIQKAQFVESEERKRDTDDGGERRHCDQVNVPFLRVKGNQSQHKKKNPPSLIVKMK
jgi:hypothetical protein